MLLGYWFHQVYAEGFVKKRDSCFDHSKFEVPTMEHLDWSSPLRTLAWELD